MILRKRRTFQNSNERDIQSRRNYVKEGQENNLQLIFEVSQHDAVLETRIQGLFIKNDNKQ